VKSRLALALFATTCAVFAAIGVFAISRINAQPDGPEAVHTADSPFRGAGRMRFVLGTRRQLQPVWRGFAVQPQLRDSEHQAIITLVDRRGRQRVAVSIDQTTPEDLAHDIGVLERE
jgi:protein SCO1/2